LKREPSRAESSSTSFLDNFAIAKALYLSPDRGCGISAARGFKRSKTKSYLKAKISKGLFLNR